VFAVADVQQVLNFLKLPFVIQFSRDCVFLSFYAVGATAIRSLRPLLSRHHSPLLCQTFPSDEYITPPIPPIYMIIDPPSTTVRRTLMLHAAAVI
jgi:hypothetical protein